MIEIQKTDCVLCGKFHDYDKVESSVEQSPFGNLWGFYDVKRGPFIE